MNDNDSETSPLEQLQKIWSRLDAEKRHALASWVLHHCVTCGREGEWEGKNPILDNEWCDACCAEGMASLDAENGEAAP
jgi:hypothetical protein